jgi:hypothetical protein
MSLPGSNFAADTAACLFAHVQVNAMALLAKWDGRISFLTLQHQTKLPADLNTLIVKWHTQ